MTSTTRRILNGITLIGVVGLLVLAWLLYFHNDALTSHLPAFLRAPLSHLGQKSEAAAEADEDPDNTKNEIPVHTARVTVATLHRYVEGFGIVSPRPARGADPAGSATLVSPVAGIVAKLLCQPGQAVHANDPLLQLDDRAAAANVEQSQAALAQAEASLAALKATPRPDQLKIAELAVQKAQAAADFARKNQARLQQLASDQLTAGKNLEQAAQDLATAENDLTVAQRQLDILKNSPTPEDLRQETAKVTAAQAALAAAKLQKNLLSLTAPIDATVVTVSANPGEAVDTTKPLITLVALDRLMVDVDIPADQLPDNAATLTTEILPAVTSAPTTTAPAPIQARVSFVSPQVDPKSGAVQVAIDLPADVRLRPGLSVRVRLVADEHKDVLAVPREAVVTDENGDTVIATVEGDQATHKHVKASLQENGLVEIVADGLKEGDTVVTAGAFGLPQASRVKVSD
jgi:multidrug efflux pump subunit AcrA (membrane-fusion protein)